MDIYEELKQEEILRRAQQMLWDGAPEEVKETLLVVASGLDAIEQLRKMMEDNGTQHNG